jgi:endo-1,4-beta-xylanase
MHLRIKYFSQTGNVRVIRAIPFIRDKFSLLFIFLTLCLSVEAQNSKGLKDYYNGLFPIGAAVTPRSLKGPDSLLLVTHFNSLTAENAMKMGPLHPAEDRYNWGPADSIVDFAVKHGMKMRGHTLVWHSQAPGWIFRDAEGKQVSKEVLLQRMKDHITTVVTRYKGKIYAWDVVNEVIADDSGFYRNSPWYQICGEDFIIKAFQWAHEADPDALLFYNDYNTENPKKREKIYTMVKKLVDAKVPIHGVGLQGHYNIYDSSLAKELPASIEKFASLGLKVQVTELDISVYPSENGRRRKRPDESDEFTPEMERKQIEQYKTVFNAFLKYRDQLTGVTFWNVSDRQSWLDNFPVFGRKNYPLLFDKDNKPKRVYYEVINMVGEGGQERKRGF